MKILTIVHASLCFGLALFTSFAYVQNGEFSTPNVSDDIFVYIVPIVAMAGYFGSKYLYQNFIQKIPKEEHLSTKLQRYQLASLIKCALLEGSAFVALFAYFYSGNAMHLVITLSFLAYLFFQSPTLDKLKNEINLNQEELQQFK